MWTTHFAEATVQHISGMARLTSRQGRLRRLSSERDRDLCGGSGIRVKQLAGLKHRMHYYCQFAGHSYGSSFAADPLSKLQTPCAQRAVSRLRVRMTAAAS